MQKHQGALLMRGTPRMRAEVAERAIVRRVTMKDTTATDARCVLDIIVKVAPTKPPRGEALGLLTPPRGRQRGAIEKVATSLVLATIAKAAINLAKAAIAPDIIEKTAPTKPPRGEASGLVTPPRGRQRGAIVKVATVLATIATEKAAINSVKVVTIVVLALKATILMQSTA